MSYQPWICSCMQTTNDGIYGFTFIAFYELKMPISIG